MKKYQHITYFIGLLEGDKYGEWVYDDVGISGKKEPFVIYTETVTALVKEIESVKINYMELYQNLSESANGVQSCENVLSALNAIIKSDRLSPGKGILLARLTDGTVKTLLNLLKTLDK